MLYRFGALFLWADWGMMLFLAKLQEASPSDTANLIVAISGTLAVLVTLLTVLNTTRNDSLKNLQAIYNKASERYEKQIEKLEKQLAEKDEELRECLEK